MGAFFSSPGKAEEKEDTCEQPDNFKREYSRFRDEAGERDPRSRRNGAYSAC